MDSDGRSVGELVFSALDLETTGISPFSDRVVEVGIVRFTINRVIEEFSTLVDPQTHISSEVQMIHGISNEMVAGKTIFADVIPDIERMIEGTELVIQNPSFDISFLEMEYLRAKIPHRFPRAFDTVTLARKAFPGLYNYKLGTISAYLGVEGASHRALGDARACMAVFLRAMGVFGVTADAPAISIMNHAGEVSVGRVIEHASDARCRGGVISVGKRAVISYLDKSGALTERMILPHKIFRKGKNTVIQAYCFLREEERIFQASRIQSVRFL